MSAKQTARWLAIFLAVFLGAQQAKLGAQDWFRTGTGLGVQKVKLALPDFAARNVPAQSPANTFNQVLWSDLEYSGLIEMVSKSFYPPPQNWPSSADQFKPQDWSDPPASAMMVAFGNLSVTTNDLAVAAWLRDAGNSGAPPVVQKIYRGQATDQDARRLAHQFADDIISRLSGGVPGIAATRIAYVSNRSGRKEIWVMDYDGSNQTQVTHQLSTIALTPRWSPDGTQIAFTCYVPFQHVVSAQVCIYSMETGKPIAFPRFHGTNATPAWSPDGSKLAFMSSEMGNPQVFVADSNGGHLHRLTYSVGVDTSPMWNPKTGQQIVFVSDRGGLPSLYVMNADGTNVTKIDLPDMGYVIDPSWAPNGQLLAFSWQRPSGNYDIYVMDIASHQLLELTRDAGRNERPSGAPDGRHLVFESTRTGSRQIWSMLADGSDARQLTTAGQNESPSWSSR
jgi:TolB protein